MLRAACSSAGARCKHRWHSNSAWVTRFSAAAYPHFSQPSEVCRGSTSIQMRPASSALARRIETKHSVTIFRPLHAVEPARTFKPRIARLDTGLGRLDPPEKPGERPIQPAQGGLLTRKRPHLHIRAHRPNLGQLRRLIPVVNTGLARRPRIPTLLQRRVIKLPVGFHTRRQRDVLARRGPHPKHTRPSHDAITASHRCSI
jgi:hypothetical protein